MIAALRVLLEYVLIREAILKVNSLKLVLMGLLKVFNGRLCLFLTEK
jgi:hypothetical protein